MSRKNNQLIMDAVNMHRLTNGLKPLRQADPRLYELAQSTAERIISTGKIVNPNLSKTSNKKTVLVAALVSGDTSVKEFVYDLNDSIFEYL